MRLAVVAEQLRAAVPGGTGRYTRELLDALTALADGAADPMDAVGEWYALGGGWGAPADRVRRPALAELWRRGLGPTPRHADVVFAPTPLAPPRRGRPLIVTIHDAVPWSAPETLTPRGARWHRDMGRRIAQSADVVVTPTAATAEELGHYLPLRRVEVIGEGVSPAVAAIPPDLAARAERLRLPPAYALAVGTVEPRKGLDVAAAALHDPNWPDLPLLIVGPAGWGDVSLPAGGKGVRLLGRLSDADLATAYARASVFVMPSRAEGFGLPVVEAMAHGVPVVVSDAPALVEVADRAGVVVPRGDVAALAAGVRQALADRHRLAILGKSRSSAFTWELAARHLWQICRDLLEMSVHNRRR